MNLNRVLPLCCKLSGTNIHFQISHTNCFTLLLEWTRSSTDKSKAYNSMTGVIINPHTQNTGYTHLLKDSGWSNEDVQLVCKFVIL